MKIGRFRVNFSPWRRRVGKNLMRHPGKRIYRRFRISNQIFGSISGSGDIARSLDTTFCRFWPKSQLCGWISREPDFCWTCGFRRLFIDTLYYRFQSKKDGSSWLDFQKMSKNHSKMYIFVLYGWTKFFFENRASSLFYIYQSLTSCKKSEKSNDGKYENFWDRRTDRRTDCFVFVCTFFYSCKGESEPGGVFVDICTGSPNTKLYLFRLLTVFSITRFFIRNFRVEGVKVS